MKREALDALALAEIPGGVSSATLAHPVYAVLRIPLFIGLKLLEHHANVAHPPGRCARPSAEAARPHDAADDAQQAGYAVTTSDMKSMWRYRRIRVPPIGSTSAL